MGRPRRSRLVLVTWTIFGLLLASPVALSIWNAAETQLKLHRGLQAITTVKVWGAGMRTREEHFCPCALVARPERVYYETSDPDEIRDFISLLTPRFYLDLGMISANCSDVTIDFLQGEKRVFWIHLKGTDLPSPEGFLPITSGSRERIDDWLKQHSVRERIAADLMRRK